MRSAQDLFAELNALDESNRIEAKRASDIGKSIMETVIAFANEPGLEGGYLLLGAEWSVNAKGDTVYRPASLPDPDKLQRDLASQCANMLSVALRPEMQLEQVDGHTVLVVYVAEADVTQKPIYKKATGLPGGAYRRVGSTDQRCVDEDLWVLRGQSQPSHGPDASLLPDARPDDFDPAALTEYRRVRQRLNPGAEELAYGDDELLEALGAVRRVHESLRPTLAGIVLFGKPMALRRMLPMVKIDYIRVPGLEWIEDPHERFQSVEIRKPLLLALPLAEATVIDELPKGFHLPEGELHSVQEPIVPRKVIREALANAVMHRSYTQHSPIQIIRYSNRIEIRNVGHSLKPVAELGIPGSRLRNPTLAAVLHDLNLAEAKGTGIRSMRRLAAEAGLTLPEFHSSRETDEFRVTLFLHNLLTEDDHAWLRSLTTEALDADEVKVLIYARATGAVDNGACRDFSGLDTLAASRVLRRLRDRGLLDKRGRGSSTHYALPAGPDADAAAAEAGGQTRLPLEVPAAVGESPYGDSRNPHMPALESPHARHVEIPEALRQRIQAAGKKPRQAVVRSLVQALCGLRPFTAAELATLLGGRDAGELKRLHLKPLREAGVLTLLYPESEKHPHQAYLTVPEDQQEPSREA